MTKPTSADLARRAQKQSERQDLGMGTRLAQNAAFSEKTARAKAAADQTASYTAAPPATTYTPPPTTPVTSVTVDRSGDAVEGIRASRTDTTATHIPPPPSSPPPNVVPYWKRASDAVKRPNPFMGPVDSNHPVTGGGNIFANPTVNNKDIFAKPTDNSGIFGYTDRANPAFTLTPKDNSVPVIPPEDKNKLPYGAIGFTDAGLPYYGDGFQGWSRKTWADLTDPAKYFQSQSTLPAEKRAEIKATYDKEVVDLSAKYEGVTKWANFIGSTFGGAGLLGAAVKPENIAALVAGVHAEQNIVQANNDTTATTKDNTSVAATTMARGVRLAVDTTQNLLWAGMDVLGLGDTTMRKAISFREGLDAVADKYNKDESSQAATVAKFLVKPLDMFGSWKDLYTVAKNNAWSDINPLNKESTTAKYMAGSDMAYTMVFDKMQENEFNKQVAEGKDPALVAQNLGNIGLELAGSILGDPTNLMGASLYGKAAKGAGELVPFVGRGAEFINGIFGTEIKVLRLPWKVVGELPTAGEIFGLGIGKARLATVADRFTETAPVLKELESILKGADANPESAAKALEEATHFIADAFDKQRKGTWNLATLNSTGKINVASRDADLFFGGILAREGDPTKAALIIQDVINLHKGGDTALESATRLMTRTDTSVFSEVGLMVGGVLARLDEIDIEKIFKSHVGEMEVSGLHADLNKALHGVLEEFIPSVQDMIAADTKMIDVEKELRTTLAGVDNAKDIIKDVKTARGEDAMKIIHSALEGKVEAGQLARYETQIANVLKNNDRTIQLSNMAREVDPTVMAITKMIELPRWTAQKQTSGMRYAFMEFVGRFTARNMMGAVLPISNQVGLTKALEIVAESAIALPNQRVAGEVGNITNAAVTFEEFVARESGKLEKLFGQSLPGLGTASDFITDEGKYFKGMLEGQVIKAGRNEQALSLGIIREYGKSQIIKDMPKVLNTTPEYETLITALGKEQGGLFAAMLEKNYGVFDDALSEFRALSADGEIMLGRVTKMPLVMEKQLDHLGMLDSVQALQRSGGEFSEVEKALNNFKEKYLSTVMEEAKKMPSQWGNPPEAEQKFFAAIEEAAPDDLVRETAKSAQNMRGQLNKFITEFNVRINKVVDAALKESGEAAQSMSDARSVAIQKIGEITNIDNSPHEFLNATLDKALSFYNEAKGAKSEGGLSQQRIIEMWNNLTEVSGEKFRLAEKLPHIDPATLTHDEFVNHLWTAVKDDRAEHWKYFNQRIYADTLDTLEEFAKGVGADFHQLAYADKGGDNAFQMLQDFNKTYMDNENQHMTLRYLNKYAGMPDMLISKISDKVDPVFIEKLVNDHIDKVAKEAASVASNAITRKANPLTYLKDHGGLNSVDVLEIFGERNTNDILPGLMKKSADSLDKAAYRLVEGGFITEEQSKDLGWVGDYLREFRKGVNPSEAKINAEQLAQMMPDHFVDGKLPYSEITVSQARDALRDYGGVPSYYEGGQISEARALYEGRNNFLNDVSRWTDQLRDDWGRTVKTSVTNVEKELSDFRAAYEPKMAVIRNNAAVSAVSARNFALHSYDKTYLDDALTLVLQNSLHYWSTRSYARTIETMVDKPGTANAYMKYKEFMSKKNADQPEWYRQNIDVGSLLGISGTPLFFNLEKAVNPIEGLTGVDFDDPYKRVDWMSRMVSDVGKMGVSMSPLINFAIAARMASKGQAEAAARWTGRVIPQSGLIKSASSFIDNVVNQFKPKDANGNVIDPMNPVSLELDPGVLLNSTGNVFTATEPYERNKIVASLAFLVQDGKITKEQMLEAVRVGKGQESQDPNAMKIWQMGIDATGEKRAVGDLMSITLGAGLKPRTQSDMVIEKFYNDVTMLQNNREYMTPDQYKSAMLTLSKNPDYGEFADALLLSKKTGEGLDAGYIYNVLGRIPPGQLSDVSKIAGLSSEQISKFYDSKGNFAEMGLSASDKKNFDAAIMDMALMYKMPDTATRSEWNEVTSMNNQIKEELATKYGAGINDIIQKSYELKGAEKAQYMEAHPEIEQALNDQVQYKMNNPLLMKYSDTMDTAERYYAIQSTQALEKKYPEQLRNDAALLSANETDAEERAAIIRDHSELRSYQYDYANAKDAALAKLDPKWEVYLEKAPDQILPDGSTNKAYTSYMKPYNKALSPLVKAEQTAVNTKYGEAVRYDARIYSSADAEKKTELEHKYSQLETYLDEKASWNDQNMRDLVNFQEYMPQEARPQLRPENQPQSGDAQQQALTNYANNVPEIPKRTFAEWTKEIGSPITEVIQEAWTSNEVMPYEVLQSLEHDMNRYGYTSQYDFLRDILLSLQN